MDMLPADLLRLYHPTPKNCFTTFSVFAMAPYPSGRGPSARPLLTLTFHHFLTPSCVPTDQRPAARAKNTRNKKQCAGSPAHKAAWQRLIARGEAVSRAGCRARPFPPPAAECPEQRARQQRAATAGSIIHPYRHQRAEHRNPATRLRTSSARKSPCGSAGGRR